MTRSEIAKFLILRSIGNFLVLVSIYGVVATFGPALYYESQYRIAQFRGIQYRVATPEEDLLGQLAKEKGPKGEQQPQNQGGGLAQVLAGPKEQILIPNDTDFSILIPKIGATAPIIPNIDPINEKEYVKALQAGVAHAKGSVFPGIKGNTYLFAHSADSFWNAGRYNAVFYLLKDLSPQDDIVVFFENRRHNYKVTESKIVNPDEVSDLVKAQESGEEKLIMQTCWPPGTTWKRLIVTAKPS